MYIDFVPIESYSFFYASIIFFVAVISFLHLYLLSFKSKDNIIYLKGIAPIVLLFAVIYIGFRPLDEIFVDMITYNYLFERYANGAPITSTKDVFFHLFVKFCSSIMPANIFFLVCSLLYILPLYLVSKKWFGNFWFYAFLMLIGSFSFWGYGVNGIRNGIATSLFLLAVSHEKRLYQILLLLISIAFHKSMLLPLAGYILTFFNNNSKNYLAFWLFSIPLSLAFPGFWESFFASFIEDDRASYLLNQLEGDKFSKTGFRWDFLLYSSSGVFAGCYFVFKKKFKDELYLKLFNTFLFSNAFWVLVIRANFSNRFAYLSWFMLAIIIVYPFLKNINYKNQYKGTALIMLLYICFTYAMSLLGNT